MIDFSGYSHRKEKQKGLELTSLIDMVFLLLIFFLLTSYYTKPALPVTLPESETAEVHKQSSVVIVVRKDGTLLLENNQVSMEILPSLLRTLLSSTSEKNVHIQADEGVYFKRIVSLMDSAYKAGAKEIYFIVEKKEKADE